VTEKTRNCYAVIPGYREAGRIGPVVEAVRGFLDRVVVVDDGSDDDTAAEAARAGAVVLKHETNRGKGVALETGFRWGREQGLEAVITLDADGQHAPADIPAFLDAYRRGTAPVLVGNRMDNPVGMPFVRRMTNRFMSWLLSREMKQRVPDTQCGYRLYRIDVLEGIACGARFDAESEILLALAARGVKLGAVPVQVIYGDEKSKIHPVRDTIRFFRMLHRWKHEGE
jgi:glycosyltransferase involved in cell wall biosynthesis